ncbi:MAG: hypothetical protein ACI8XB_001129 [Patiriisocius sp.]|jgi:hypothetical protein
MRIVIPNNFHIFRFKLILVSFILNGVYMQIISVDHAGCILEIVDVS